MSNKGMIMVHRQIGDAALALLLALPTAVLARPEPSIAVRHAAGAAAPLLTKAAMAERPSLDKRAELLG
jgi:hypothetical protein